LGLVLEHKKFEEESKHVYLLASGIEVNRQGEYSCPLKTFAVFVHN